MQIPRLFFGDVMTWQPDKSSLQVMGILNVTPDSFSDGGQYRFLNAALQRVEEILMEGVDIIDIGGESTRPGAPAVSAQEELDRVIPVIEAIRLNVLLFLCPLIRVNL